MACRAVIVHYNVTVTSGLARRPHSHHAPGPPAITRIHSTTSDSLLVVWEPPEKPRGIITNYSVTWNTSVVPGVTGNITQYTITSLEACTLYNITVKAATIKGYGDCVDANGTTGSKREFNTN
ncbi:sidekick-1-like 5, partial [Homarus americanus]